METASIVIALAFLALPFVSIFALHKWWSVRRDKKETEARLTGTIQALETRFKPIIDIENEVRQLENQATEIRSAIEALRADYASKGSTYDILAKEVAIFDEKLAFAEMGVYEPQFDFTDSEAHKNAIQDVREKQK